MLPEKHTLREAQDFFLALFKTAPPEQWIEFAAVASERLCKKNPTLVKVKVEYCQVRTLEKSFDLVIADWILERNGRDKYEAYFGVCPRSEVRKTASGYARRATKAQVTTATCAWVDLDREDWQVFLDQVKPNASALVATGHGLHLYFFYPEAVPVDQASEDSKALSGPWNGDKTHNADRLLRVPGTINWKKEDAQECRVLSLNPDLKFAGAKKAAEEPKGELATLEWDLRNVILGGYEAAVPPFSSGVDSGDRDKSRSAIDFHVMVEMYKQGASDELVESTFKNPEYGISEKTLEEAQRGNAEHYLGMSMRKAKAKAEAERATFQSIGDVLVLESTETLKKAPPLTFAIERILPVTGMMMLSGPAKTGKSLALLDMLLLLAGAPGAVFDRFKVLVPGPTVYVQAEVSRGSLKFRLDTVGVSRGVLWEKLPLHFYCGRLNLADFHHCKALTAALKKAGAKYVAVDPLARFHLKNENSQADMSLVLSNLERAGREAGLFGTILVHHHGKPSGDNAREGVQRLRGASVLGDWGNAHVIMRKQFSEATETKYVRIQFELRDAEEPHPLNLALDPETLRFRMYSEEEEKLAITLGVVDTSTSSGTSKKEVVAELKDRLGTTKSEAERLISKARAKSKAKAKEEEEAKPEGAA